MWPSQKKKYIFPLMILFFERPLPGFNVTLYAAKSCGTVLSVLGELLEFDLDFVLLSAIYHDNNTQIA